MSTDTTTSTRTVTLGDRDVVIQRVSARKATRAFAILRAVGGKVPELVNEWGTFQRDYEAAHTTELDRAQAELRFGPRAVEDEYGDPVRYPDELKVEDELVPHPRAGEVVMVPGLLEHMTEEAWAKVDNKIRMPRSPSTPEAIAAVAPLALDVAEEHIYRLLALFTMPNDAVKRARKSDTLDEELDAIVEELLDDAMADEVLELAVVCGEVIDAQFTAKTRELGDRLGNALRLIGLDPTGLAANQGPTTPQTGPEPTQTRQEDEEPTSSSSSSASSPEDPSTASSSPEASPAETSPAPSTPTPSSSRPASSTDSPGSTDGEPTTSSTSPTSSSPQLAGASTSSENG